MSTKDTVVLIVDDEPDILELMEEEFIDAGYSTKTASCGNDAAEIVRQERIHIVLSDFKMPNGNGMTVLNAVNELPVDQRPAFFFISGQADISVQEALDAGAKKFFTKPFDFETLLDEISRLS